MNTAYILLGSNIDPEKNLAAAVKYLAENYALLRVSPVYETKAVGDAAQPNFLNAACMVDTALDAAQLKENLATIEQNLGRVRSPNPNSARTIDLDVVLFNQEVLTLGKRQLPDPDILRHAHVALPLADIAPDYVHPVEGASLAVIARRFQQMEDIKLRDDVDLTNFVTKMDANMAPLDINVHDFEVFRPEIADEPGWANEQIETAVRNLLTAIGENPDRQGLHRTPTRVAKMYEELTSGYHVDPVALVNDAIFDIHYDEMVLIKNIDYYSLCEHHLLPFMGKAHVAYIPKGKVLGLSKIPRIVEMYARRLQVQERMTMQIAEFIEHLLEPYGVAVVCEGLHLCSTMRGVKKANARMVTSAMLGSFRTNPQTRNEFLKHVNRHSDED